MLEIPVVDPATADGVFSLLWLVIALPLLGAVVLLVGGAAVPKVVDRWGHLLGCLLPIGSFLISLAMFITLPATSATSSCSIGSSPFRRSARVAQKHPHNSSF